jgi:hypothetical protein
MLGAAIKSMGTMPGSPRHMKIIQSATFPGDCIVEHPLSSKEGGGERERGKEGDCVLMIIAVLWISESPAASFMHGNV